MHKEKNIDINSLFNIVNTQRNGKTLMQICARNGNIQLVEFFVKNGVSVNQDNSSGWTALHEACLHNAKKCNTMRVTSSPKPISFDYSIHNTVLENVPHTKYLGVTIQSNLKWDVHCKQVAAKATNTLNVLKRNLKSTKEVRERAYKSLVRPQVEYAASVWSPWLARDKARIERVQHRAARYVYNTYSRYSSVTAMLQSLDWETLESRRFNMRLCIIYKAYYNLAIFPLSDYTTPITVQTRGNNIKFILPHCSKDVFKHSFLPAALRGWNALPQSAVEATSLELFKASLPGVTY